MSVLHALCAQAAKSPLRIRSAINEPGTFENTQMLRYCRQRNVERLREFSNSCLSLRQTRENRTARRIGQGGKRFR